MSQLRASALRLKRRAEPFVAELTHPPVDLEPIIARLGGEVREMPLEPDVCGILVWEDDRKILVVNANHDHRRRRVSLARQIGHLVLHRRTSARPDHGVRINVRSPLVGLLDNIEEIEASVFALYLLMPEAWLGPQWEGASLDFSDDAQLKALAEHYGVPEAFVLPRLLLEQDV